MKFSLVLKYFNCKSFTIASVAMVTIKIATRNILLTDSDEGYFLCSAYERNEMKMCSSSLVFIEIL